MLTLVGGGAGCVPRQPGTTEPPAAAPTLSPTPSPTPDYLGMARAKVSAYLAELGNGQVTLAVRDRRSDLALTVGGTRFPTASIVKVDILAALLLRAQGRHEELTDSDRRNAKRMITLSDNDAATTLFHRIGGKSGLATANRTFGLKQTTPNSSWGRTTTTAADQIRLLAAIADEDGPLDEDGRSYLFDLMSQVDAGQDWGVPAAAGPRATAVYVKNGWDNISADGGRWQVNTIGRIVEPGRDWLVAVLSHGHQTQSAGIRMIEAAARFTLGELRKIPLQPT
ncbi:beta-lactamase class A [Asanoa ferruginea]|uniref:Beta-lactamase class A n=1 Tax=Asanoa ferruginea TaxID=53367 RepID=A0A3D9ZVL1_9ACTN|nr:beta-lactamase class A [Asanoa ferruginea]